MRIEGICYFEVVGHEGTKPVPARIRTFGNSTGYGNVGTAMERYQSIGKARKGEKRLTNAEKKRPLPVRTVI